MYFAYFIVNTITKPLNAVTKNMQAMSAGNLNQQPMEIKSKGETGILAQNFNGLLTNIKSLVHNTGESLGGNTDNDKFGLSGDFDKSLQDILASP